MDKLENLELRVDNFIKKGSRIIFRNPNIVGYGRGLKIINNALTDIPCLTIYVENKFPIDNLDKTKTIPKYINGVLTDIVECGSQISLQQNKGIKKLNSYNLVPTGKIELYSGASIGNVNNCYGGTLTLGLIKDSPDGIETYLLGCATSLTTIADGKLKNISDSVVNPSRKATGYRVRYKVGEITNISKVDLYQSRDNKNSTAVDAALINVEDNVFVSPGIVSPEGRKIIGIKGITNVSNNENVKYVGAASGEISGQVISVNSRWIKLLQDTKEQIWSVKYEDVTVVKGKFAPGDEGALGFVNKILGGNYAFGMLVAATENYVVFANLNKTIEYINTKGNFKLIK